jgi:cell division protein FtsB
LNTVEFRGAGGNLNDDTVELTAAAEKIAVLEKENEALKAQIKALETQLPKRMPKIDLAKTEASIRAQVCI